jgi:hypothetical protein
VSVGQSLIIELEEAIQSGSKDKRIDALRRITDLFVSLISQPRMTSNVEPEPSAVASIAAGKRQTTIIVSTPNSNDCRRYQLNVDTGARNEQGQGPISCNADSSKQPGRLEAISKSFRNH